MTVQRYVSDELTHFIGRDLVREMRSKDGRDERDDKLYERLVSILGEGTLLAGGGKYVEADAHGRTVVIKVTYSGKPNLADMFEPSVVCFCDIPVGDVGIHIGKYGPFGLAFDRRFLLKHGVNPVLYLAEDAMVDGWPAGKLFADEMKHAIDCIGELYAGDRADEVPDEVSAAARRAHGFLMVHAFPLIKGFRGKSPDEDPENFEPGRV